MNDNTTLTEVRKTISEESPVEISCTLERQSDEICNESFICECDAEYRSACEGFPFYKEMEGKLYCVLHFPSQNKTESFNEALNRKIVKNDLNFNGVWFSEEVHFDSYLFDKEASFFSAIFNAPVSFTKARFENESCFKDSQFRATATFSNAQFYKPVDFSEVQFSALADFRGVYFGSKASFENTLFKGTSLFSQDQFIGNAEFRKASFHKKADFTHSHFESYADFFGVSFLGKALFNNTVFNKRAVFRSNKFQAGSDFSDSIFNADAEFLDGEFFREAIFLNARFVQSAYFTGSKFCNEAYFFECKFNSDTHFFDVIFDGNADFSYSQFSSEADFIWARFNGCLTLNNTLFKDYVRFAGLEKLASLHQFPYQQNREIQAFTRCTLLDLQHIRIEKPDKVSFHTITLHPYWFIDTDIRKFEFINVQWENSLKEEISIFKAQNLHHNRHYAFLSKTFREIALNYEENHHYEEAAKFRYFAMDAQRLETWRGGAFWKLRWWYWAASGYGERVLRALLVLIGIWLLLASLYTQVGFARWEPKLTSESDIATNQRDVIGNPLTFPRAMAYSFATMALQKPEPKPATTTAQALVTFETVLGPLQAALLALAIRRKFMR